jgi:hypothetical protein
MPGKNREPPLSVKCDACSTGIMALALLLYPQKNKLPKEKKALDAVLSGSYREGHVLWKTNIPFVFSVHHHGKDQKSPSENLNVPSEFHGVTWEKHKLPKKKQNQIKIAQLESLILIHEAPKWCKTRSDVESLWTNVWMNGVLLKPKAKKNVEDRTFEWHKISKVQDSGKKKSREEKKEEKSKSRKKFYEKLKNEGVWTFTPNMSDARINTAVKHIARVIERVHKDYKGMTMKEFLSVCGLAELQRVYTFLLDFVGDLIEEKLPSAMSLNFEHSAADIAASGLLHTESTLGAAGKRRG